MAAINPVSGVTPPTGSPGVSGATLKQQGAGKSGFADTLRDYVSQVDARQQNASSAIQDLVSGKTDSVLPVVSAVADADMSFKLLVGVRNKVIEAYKQTMNMQI
jgi:flagellar hook-basal body complex protein FliE